MTSLDTDQMMMGLRDASWYNHPDVRSPKVYHVIISPPYVAACDSRVQIDPNSEAKVAATHRGMRCHRRPCLDRWSQVKDYEDEGAV